MTLPPALAGISAPPDVTEAPILSGRRPVLELLRAGGTVERVLIAQGLKPSEVIGEIRRRAEEAAIPVRMVPRSELDRLAEGANHQGVLAATGRYRYAPLDRLLEARGSLLFLDGITDPHNLGSLLRSADGAGFGGVVIPAHRAAPVTPAVRRVAAGAAEVVPVCRVENLNSAIEAAKRAGLWVVGLDEDADGDVWTSELLEPPVVLVLGAEGKGIRPGVVDRLDGSVSIPQRGRIGSLNVAVAGAIAMFEVARRRTAPSGSL